MAFCTNCGAECSDEASVCLKCGAALQGSQNAGRKTKAEANGLCSAGLTFSIIGVFLLGLTSVLGLILSFFGLISAGKKKQRGKGRAVAGIILSLLMIAALAVTYVFYRNTLMDKYEAMTGKTFPTRRVTVDYGDRFEESGWVVVQDETCMRFDKEDHTFKNFLCYLDDSEMYMTGSYELYSDKEAVGYLAENAGVPYIEDEGDVEYLYRREDRYCREKLIALTCVYKAFVNNGQSQSGFDPVTYHFYGFYVLVAKGDRVFDAVEMHNLEEGTSFTMIREDQYDYYWLASEDEPAETEAPDDAD